MLYDRSKTVDDWVGTRTDTEKLTLSGTASFGASFGVSLLNGVTVSVQSSGSGETKYASATVWDYGLPDFSAPSQWYSNSHYPGMRDELTINTTGSFAANVTLTISLFGGINIDATVSAQSQTVATELDRSDWAYWETGPDGVNTYSELGYAALIQTTISKVSGSLANGFTSSLDQQSKIDSDITTTGIKQSGTPTVAPEPQETTASGTGYFVLDFLSALPETFASGEAFDSLYGSVTNMVDTMLLGKTNFSDAGAVFGNHEAFAQGEVVGTIWGAFNLGAIAAYEMPILLRNIQSVSSSISSALPKTIMSFPVPELAYTTAEGAVFVPIFAVTTADAIGLTSIATLSGMFFTNKIDWNNFDEDADYNDTHQRMLQGNNQYHNEQVERIAKELGMDASKRDLLHQAISKKGYSLDEIMKIAREIMGQIVD